MNKIKHILICCGQYPTKSDPIFSFVEQIVNAFAKHGIFVSVVAPQSITKYFLRKVPLHPVYRKIETTGCSSIEIFQPYSISFGSRFVLLNRFFRKIALWYALKHLRSKPDVCYGHFWHSAIALYNFAKKNNVPLFVASGEASIKNETHATYNDINEFLNFYRGVFFASSKNKKESISLGFLTKQKNIVIPNAIDSSLFYLKNKKELRDRFHISQNFFIVAFVGSFINRKGPDRVAQALNRLKNDNIKAFFIGSEHDGVKYDFDYDGILLKGVVEHHNLVDYLNMADIFVLPTLAEGCCNAIIEAMACGLPIVSSNRDFNDDILDDSYSFRIDPESVEEIANAIKKLYDNPELCKMMSEAALQKASTMTIEKRAKKIIDFMNNCLGENCHVDMA